MSKYASVSQYRHANKTIAIVQSDRLLGECLHTSLQTIMACKVLGNWVRLAELPMDSGSNTADIVVISFAALQRATLQTLKSLQQKNHQLRVVLTHFPVLCQSEPQFAEILAFVHAVVLEGASLNRLVAQIKSVIDDEYAAIEEVSSSGELQLVDVRLTRREKQITLAIKGGLSNKEIARALHIELSTVKNHVHNIIDKLGVDTRWEAVSIAEFNGLLGDDVPLARFA